MFRKVSLGLFQARLQLLRRGLATSNAASMDPRQLFEEECLPHYNHNQFYPVRVGQYLSSRYKVMGKLGYGSDSTVWLCRNIGYAEDDSSNSAGTNVPRTATTNMLL
jgi:serine/threonine-protein kinase SRPK3